MNTKVCKDCNELKSLSEFYKHKESADGFHNKCKSCMKAYANNRYKASKKVKNKENLGREFELGFVRYLLENGIYSSLGRKSKQHDWADVVAWGCVTIELKSSNQTNNRYHFNFSEYQRERGLVADIVCLHLVDKDTYHFFGNQNPIFYRAGKLKRTLSYYPKPKSRKNRWAVLEPEIMLMAKDHLYMIERTRMSKAQERLQELLAA